MEKDLHSRHLAARPTLPSSARTTSGSTTPQVRPYTALTRHLLLTIAALAVCAITAAQARTRTPAPTLPTRGDQLPPEDPGLVPLTVAETRRLSNLLIRRAQDAAHHLHWTWWRRRHQARARWFHHRTRLRQQDSTT